MQLIKRHWRPGEKVMLNTGGPKMTVVGTDKVGLVMCRWLQRNQTQKKQSFHSNCLRTV